MADAGEHAPLAGVAPRGAELVPWLPGLGIADQHGARAGADDDGATGAAGVYAGGDCRNGGKEVVNAVAEGDQAAQAIHTFISGGGSCRT